MRATANGASIPLLTVSLKREDDIVLARQRGRDISKFLGFSEGDTTRITTALSEIARNAYEYAGSGCVYFSIEDHGEAGQELAIRVVDEGTGIPNLPEVLARDFKSSTGLGVGISGSRALMDRFVITSSPGQPGTKVEMAKRLPARAGRRNAADVEKLQDQLKQANDASPLGELQGQNQVLLNTLRALSDHQKEVERLSLVASEARERAEAAQQVAERSLVVRERFMALTTHELRTPLNAVIGYLELLNDEIGATLTEKQRGFFTRAQRAAKHLVGVTNDFLDMAQGDAGRLTVARHEGAARHVMSEASALVAPQAAARNVTVTLSETSERVIYLGDSHRVRQVLINLLGNAVSFTPQGGEVDVVAHMEALPPEGSALEGGPWCTIRVEDSGPGIPQDKLGHVFEPFVQLSSDGQATRKGSGLGLTVSRQLAVLMGGDITVGSTGSGAIFTLWLPAGRRNEAEAAP